MYSRCNEGENLYTCVHVLQDSVDFLETKLLQLSNVQWNYLQYVVNCPHLETNQIVGLEGKLPVFVHLGCDYASYSERFSKCFQKPQVKGQSIGYLSDW